MIEVNDQPEPPLSSGENIAGPHSGSFSGPVEFQKIVRDALAWAAQVGSREMLLSDASFDDWPLGEREVCASLDSWARSGRKITLLAHNFGEIARRHPRFVVWRRRWDHIVTCRHCRSADVLDIPSAIWSPHWVMRRLDLVRSTGWCGSEPGRRIQLRETLDDWLRKSSSGFPATTLGL